MALVTLGLRLVTTGFGLSLKKLAPDLARLNPAAKLRELPRQNLPALLQAAVLLPVFLWAAYTIAREKLDAFLALPLQSVESGCGLIARALMELFWKAAERVPGLWRSGSLPPDAASQTGSPHEQTGDQGRDEGDGGQSADEGEDSPSAARPGTPAR